MMAADMLGTCVCKFIDKEQDDSLLCTGSYGSLARFRDIKRLCPVGESTIVGASGDISDYQYIQHLLDSLM